MTVTTFPATQVEQARSLGHRAWPPGFLWGSATAAGQIEGAAHQYGKEDSVWDAFARIPGAVANGDTPEVAVDHYHRMPEDVSLMKRLGLGSYRFSTSWARIKPGDRAVNQSGLDFYSRLVDELLDAGILPWLTLYHWDMPQAVEEKGGWANRDSAFRFQDYAEVVYSALGDRVQHWTTFNEPFCSSLLSYAAGLHAPGRTSREDGLASVHHQNLAHGLAARSLRELGAQNVGITLNLSNAIPADPGNPADVDAARRFDALQNRIYLEPLVLGRYPDDFQNDVSGLGFEQLVHDGDLETTSTPIDFLGVNYYHDDNVSGRPLPEGDSGFAVATDRKIASPYVGSEHITFPSRGLARTGMDWEINPDGLRHLLARLGKEYPNLPPLYVTENGAAFDDEITERGRVHDVERTQYVLDHLESVADAIDEGADVRGYFLWSLLDNYEWAWGYEKRFGMVHVDYETQVRTVKDSGLVYSSIIGNASAPKGAPSEPGS